MKEKFSIVASDKSDFEKMVVYHESKFNRIVFYIPAYADSTPLDSGFYVWLVNMINEYAITSEEIL